MNARTILGMSVAILLHAAQSEGSEQARETPPSVQVRLVIPTDAYDPSKPSTETIKCVVVNKSAGPIEVSVGYDGQSNVLQAKSEHLRWGMTLYPSQRSHEKLSSISLKSGDETVAFDLPLDGILLQRSVSQDDRKWRWDWGARPKAPFSPIYSTLNEGGFANRATFWANVLVNGKQVSSDEVALKVVTPGGEDKPTHKD